MTFDPDTVYDISMDKLREDMAKLRKASREDITVPLVNISAKWLNKELADLDIGKDVFQKMVDTAKKDAGLPFSIKSALQNMKESNFYDVDENSTTTIADFIRCQKRYRLNTKEKVRMCELLTQHLGKNFKNLYIYIYVHTQVKRS